MTIQFFDGFDDYGASNSTTLPNIYVHRGAALELTTRWKHSEV